MSDYDPRYLAGILFFNERDFFEAHEVWEALWMETTGPERKFVQGLIQAAVALLHFNNGNLRGAVKLFRSSRDYMQTFGSPYWGLDIGDFWRHMERCFAEALAADPAAPAPELHEELAPNIALEPPPASWPDPASFVSEED
jgi:predicted metal-dependent hydrolase